MCHFQFPCFQDGHKMLCKVAKSRIHVETLVVGCLFLPWPYHFSRLSDEDLRSKLQDLDALQDGILQGTSERAGELERALGVAEAFTKEYQDTIRALRDIQDNLLSQDSPGVDPATVREQQKELQVGHGDPGPRALYY